MQSAYILRKKREKDNTNKYFICKAETSSLPRPQKIVSTLLVQKGKH